MYWKSIKQQNLPVTIKYPEMVAQIFPHFEGDKLPDFGKNNLWFLQLKQIEVNNNVTYNDVLRIIIEANYKETFI